MKKTPAKLTLTKNTLFVFKSKVNELKQHITDPIPDTTTTMTTTTITH